MSLLPGRHMDARCSVAQADLCCSADDRAKLLPKKLGAENCSKPTLRLIGLLILVRFVNGTHLQRTRSSLGQRRA